MTPREREIYKVTLTGSIVNGVLIVLKFVAGIVGRSSAMIADAAHSLSDFVTDVIVLAFVKISGKPRDKGHDYGHGKYETFATMIIGFLLAVVGFMLMGDGVKTIIRAYQGEVLGQPTVLALSAAIISILSKEWLFRYTSRVSRRVNSSVVMANAWHHRSDAISSLGTLVGVAGAIFLGSSWRILDPIAAVVVSLFIIKSGFDIIRPSVDELLESSLPEEEEQQILAIVMAVDGIKHVHNMRTRRIGSNIAVDLHAKMDGNMTLTAAHDIATQAERALRAKYGENTIVNIHMESI